MTTKGFTLPPGLSVEMEMALEGVIDVTSACAAWFDFGKVPYDAADLVAMAKLAYAREREIKDEEKRRRFEERHKIGEDA
jgi:hypothetical protein